MEDSEIVALLTERSGNAIDAVSQKYGSLCTRIAMHVLDDPRDAEECVNDAYLALWNAIPPEKPDPLGAYLCRIVRNISVNRYRHNAVQKRNSRYDLCLEELESCLPDSSDVEDAVSTAELTRQINAFLQTLNEENRMLFVRRFWFLDSYEELSALTGLRQGTVRTRLTRIRNALKRYLK